MTSIQPKNPLLPSEVDLHVPVALLPFTLAAGYRDVYQQSVALIEDFVRSYSGHEERNDLLLLICDHVAHLGNVYSTQEFITILNTVGEYLRIMLLSHEYHLVYCSVIIQDALIKNGDYRVHTVIGRYINMKTFSKIARRRLLGKSKEETALGYFIADVIQAWGEAFEPRSALYPYIPETYQRLKFKHSCLFLRPDYDPTRVPIFLPEMTRKQIEEVQSLNRSSTRPGFENSGTYSAPPTKASYERDRLSLGGEERPQPTKPPLPRQRSSMSPPVKPPKPYTAVRSASMSGPPSQTDDLLDLTWPAAPSESQSSQTISEEMPSVYDERSVQHVLAAFAAPLPSSCPVKESSEGQWTPFLTTTDPATGVAASTAVPNEYSFDLKGDCRPQSMHSLLEKYVSEGYMSTPLRRDNSSSQAEVISSEHILPPISNSNVGEEKESTTKTALEEPIIDAIPDSPFENEPQTQPNLIQIIETATTTDNTSDLIFASNSVERFSSENEAPNAVVESSETPPLETNQPEASIIEPVHEANDAAIHSADRRRSKDLDVSTMEPSELEKAFAFRHVKERADREYPNENESVGSATDLHPQNAIPAKPKRDSKQGNYDPSSDKNVEVKFFGNQRVIVRKSSASAIPKYF